MLELVELYHLGILKQHKEIWIKLIFVWFFKITLVETIMPAFVNNNDIYLSQNNTSQTF